MFPHCTHVAYLEGKFFNINDQGVPLPAFPSLTNLKLDKTPVTSKIGKKVKTNLDSLKAFSPADWVPKLSYILADLFKMSMREFCFPDCWKVSFAAPVSKNIVYRSAV